MAHIKYNSLSECLEDCGQKYGYDVILQEYGKYGYKMQEKPWDILGSDRYVNRFARYVGLYLKPKI